MRALTMTARALGRRGRLRHVLPLVALVAASHLAGCALHSRGDVYAREDTRQAWDVHYGTVTDVDQVTIEGKQTHAGSVGGGFVGYEVGRAIGGGGVAGSIGGAVGSVAGAVVGSAVEEGATRQAGLQITVELDGGRSIAVVQAADQPFAVGERVKVFSRRDGAARVAKP
jgi:outer membrane lipoprotein SlyB